MEPTQSQTLDSATSTSLKGGAAVVSVKDWLSELGLERYVELFEAQEVDMTMVHLLEDADLKEMGIDKLGPRKMLLAAIEKHKKQL